MTTQNAQIYHPATVSNGSSFSLFFFLIGAPHIYSILRQRQSRKSTFQTKILNPKVIGFLSATAFGAMALTAF